VAFCPLVMAKGRCPPGSQRTSDLSIHPGEVVLLPTPIGMRPRPTLLTLVGGLRQVSRPSAGAGQAAEGIEPGAASAARQDRLIFPGPQPAAVSQRRAEVQMGLRPAAGSELTGPGVISARMAAWRWAANHLAKAPPRPLRWRRPQRVRIARALAAPLPRLLLADENPTAALDSRSGPGNVVDLLKGPGREQGLRRAAGERPRPAQSRWADRLWKWRNGRLRLSSLVAHTVALP